ncbi:MAG TPA: hypothetical protein VMH30_05555 [Verrucomicrobiae bacterium]|nr:hypothetical protein [Verrucomicrobiae bacterium]
MAAEKAALAALPGKYAPEMDFADATLVRTSELQPTFKRVTGDGHFHWYRRNQGREAYSGYSDSRISRKT